MCCSFELFVLFLSHCKDCCLDILIFYNILYGLHLLESEVIYKFASIIITRFRIPCSIQWALKATPHIQSDLDMQTEWQFQVTFHDIWGLRDDKQDCHSCWFFSLLPILLSHCLDIGWDINVLCILVVRPIQFTSTSMSTTNTVQYRILNANSLLNLLSPS